MILGITDLQKNPPLVSVSTSTPTVSRRHFVKGNKELFHISAKIYNVKGKGLLSQ